MRAIRCDFSCRVTSKSQASHVACKNRANAPALRMAHCVACKNNMIPAATYSWRNATTGSTLVARRAGIHDARAATASRTAGTPTKDARSIAPRTK
jgi:hypothetical protein